MTSYHFDGTDSIDLYILQHPQSYEFLSEDSRSTSNSRNVEVKIMALEPGARLGAAQPSLDDLFWGTL